jgi:hypothetical protein
VQRKQFRAVQQTKKKNINNENKNKTTIRDHKYDTDNRMRAYDAMAREQQCAVGRRRERRACAQRTRDAVEQIVGRLARLLDRRHRALVVAHDSMRRVQLDVDLCALRAKRIVIFRNAFQNKYKSTVTNTARC